MNPTTQTQSKHIIETLKFKEFINTSKINALLESKEIINDETRKHLSNICNQVKDETLNVKYMNSPKSIDKSQRKYPVGSLSLCQVKSEVRSFLAENIYFDIDICNCNPSILVNICKSHNIKHKKLTNYVTKRDKIFKQLKKLFNWPRKVSKVFFIQLLYGNSIEGTLYNIKRDFDTTNLIINLKDLDEDDQEDEYELAQKLFKFEKEFQTISNALAKLYPDELQRITEMNIKYKKQKSSHIPSLISYLMQKTELDIIMKLFNYAKECELIKVENKFHDCVIVFDGIMMLQRNFTETTINEFIDNANAMIREYYPENIKFSAKPVEDKLIKEKLKDQGINFGESVKSPFEKKYGIREEDINLQDPTDEYLANIFIHSNQNKYIHYNKDVYKVNEYGLFKESSVQSLALHLTNHMRQFITASDNLIQKEQEQPNEDTLKQLFNLASQDKQAAKLLSKMIKTNEKYQKKSLKNNKIKDKLENNMKSSHIVKRLIQKYNNDDFESKLDNDLYLLGFDNGVLDTRTYTFRNAKPNELVSMTTRYKYKVPSRELINKVRNHIKEMFDSQENMDYVMTYIARCLRGEANKEQIALFFKGVGSNGKSLLLGFIRNALGDYFGTIDHKYFISPLQDSRDPRMYQLRKARIIDCNEPPEDFKFSSDVFKKITGNDTILARTNYQKKDTRFKPAPIIFSANHYPQFNTDTTGHSMQRRIRSYNFPHIFKDQPNPNNPNEKQKIDNLDKLGESKEYKNALMQILIDYLKLYDQQGLQDTESVIRDSKTYFDKMDEDKDWFKENIPQDPNGVNLHGDALFEYFKRSLNAFEAKKFTKRMFFKKLAGMGYTKMSAKCLKFNHTGHISSGKGQAFIKINPIFLGQSLDQLRNIQNGITNQQPQYELAMPEYRQR